jgi:hypothetical protein
MIDFLKRHKLIIGILLLLIVSNAFTIYLFCSSHDEPKGNDSPQTEINMQGAIGSSGTGPVTNVNPTATKTVFKQGDTVTTTSDTLPASDVIVPDKPANDYNIKN